MNADLRAIAEALPNYEIGGELGRGGFGVVHAGRQRGLGRAVAIKQLPPYLASDPGVRARFVAEARLLASLDHPHIVPVYDYVERDGLCLLVMECLPGGSVWETFRSRGLSYERACAIVIATAVGLQHAHAHGILHRDIKPENLLFNSEDHLKVTDFGIARVIGGKDAIATEEGGILGTPAYMAPEQAQGQDIGPAVDIYALGVMLYELLSGRLPFSQEGGAFAIIYRHIYEDPVSLEKVAPQVPRPIADAVMHALARDPANRYASAEDFAVAVGEAAVASFGIDWYARSGLLVLASQRVLRTISRGSLDGSDPHPLRDQPAVNLPDIVVTAPAAQAAGSNSVVVVPRAASHLVGEANFSDKPQPIVAVRQVLDVPSKRHNLIAAGAVVVTALMVLVALIGIGHVSTKRGLLPAGTTVAGHDVTSGGRVKVNLARRIAVRVPASSQPVYARLSLTLDHVRFAGSDRTLLNRAGDGTLNISSARHLVSGPVTGVLTLSRVDQSEIASRGFTVAPSGSGFVTIPGFIVALLILFVLAYLESLLLPLWRLGRWRVTNGVGLGLVGALTGVLLVMLAWVLGSRQPDVATAVCCAALGAVWGVLLGLTVARWGLRRRARILNRRYQADAVLAW